MASAQDSQHSTRKRSVNLSLDAALVEDARAQGVNLSRFLEAHLREALREHRERLWQEENREAIREYNDAVAKRGSFGDRFRRF
ncbi:type II toxin-antitoxin system CcdA family antitoxin [Aquisalimonas sp.]|uniref:type II toxin-antitoxin system CcdA family antitoxin n=1 Tax=Aquisalimonas sp. TaxID=1872621 RepID=UPI0025BF35F7|nr:type II toxin-antitoxin system CcdA family antitoxin [Aquisalimonas sp.]